MRGMKFLDFLSNRTSSIFDKYHVDCGDGRTQRGLQRFELDSILNTLVTPGNLFSGLPISDFRERLEPTLYHKGKLPSG